MDLIISENRSLIDFGKKMTTKKAVINSSFYTYLRAQFTALFATGFDFLVTVILKEFVGMWYVHAVAAGAATGALVAFLLNRNWVFRSRNKSIRIQAFRYGLVATGSWFLNTLGVYLLTESLDISYLYSKIFVSIFIGLTYNFILAKRFAFV